MNNFIGIIGKFWYADGEQGLLLEMVEIRRHYGMPEGENREMEIRRDMS